MNDNYEWYHSITKFLNPGTYEVDVPWEFLCHYDFDLDPEYQREHVWTLDQKIKFIEFCLRGGKSARNLYFNSVGFTQGKNNKIEVVDGKQRLSAVLEYFKDGFKVFDKYYSEVSLPTFSEMNLSFRFHIAEIKSKKVLYQWYLQMNEGGTVHTEEELNKVRQLL